MEFPLFKRCNLSCGAYQHRLYRFSNPSEKSPMLWSSPWNFGFDNNETSPFCCPQNEANPRRKKPMETLKMIDGLRDITQLIGKCRTSNRTKIEWNNLILYPPKKKVWFACLIGSLSVCVFVCLLVCFFACLVVCLFWENRYLFSKSHAKTRDSESRTKSPGRNRTKEHLKKIQLFYTPQN